MHRPAWLAPTASFLGLWLVFLLVPFVVHDDYHLDVATRIIESILLVMGLRLVLITGRLNLAHVSFAAIGAYASAAMTMQLGLSFWVALPAAGLVAAAVALPLGLVTLRLTGAYFFLVTFAFLNVVELFFQSFFTGVFGGSSGLANVPLPPALSFGGMVLSFDGKPQLYWLAVALLGMLGTVMVRLDYSRFGLVCNGIRQAERLAGVLGIDPLRYKLQALLVASFVAGVVGSFIGHSQKVVHYSDFSIDSMLRLVVFAVVGGTGTVWGAIGGTIVLSILAELLRGLRSYEALVYGGILVAAMLFLPSGLGAAARDLWAAWRPLRREGTAS